jgi:hypothetical protein
VVSTEAPGANGSRPSLPADQSGIAVSRRGQRHRLPGPQACGGLQRSPSASSKTPTCPQTQALNQEDATDSGFVCNGFSPSLYQPDNREATWELPPGLRIRDYVSKVEFAGKRLEADNDQSHC